MDPRLGRVAIGLAALAALVAAGDLARAQPPVQGDQTGPGPPPSGPPPPVGSPPAPLNAPVAPPTLPTDTPSAAPATPPSNTVSAPAPVKAAPAPAATPAPAPETPLPPPGPPPPVRSPTAILQVLDKVTAETLKFEAPVGRRIRYKTLVFTVRVCETRGPDDPKPRPSAYVVIDSETPALPGHAPLPAKEVFRGWMFANDPALHALEHPIYDAWLVACSAAAPVS